MHVQKKQIAEVEDAKQRLSESQIKVRYPCLWLACTPQAATGHV